MAMPLKPVALQLLWLGTSLTTRPTTYLFHYLSQKIIINLSIRNKNSAVVAEQNISLNFSYATFYMVLVKIRSAVGVKVRQVTRLL